MWVLGPVFLPFFVNASGVTQAGHIRSDDRLSWRETRVIRPDLRPHRADSIKLESFSHVA